MYLLSLSLLSLSLLSLLYIEASGGLWRHSSWRPLEGLWKASGDLWSGRFEAHPKRPLQLEASGGLGKPLGASGSSPAGGLWRPLEASGRHLGASGVVVLRPTQNDHSNGGLWRPLEATGGLWRPLEAF